MRRLDRMYFLLTASVLVLVFAVFPVLGRPYPGQHLGLDYSDLPAPSTLTAVWGLVPEQAGVYDARAYIPIQGFQGISASFRNQDGLVVVAFGTVRAPTPRPGLVVARSGAIWIMTLGARSGKAIVWNIGGHRWVGVAVWGPQLPDNVEVVLEAWRRSRG